MMCQSIKASTWEPSLFFKAKMLANNWCVDPKFKAAFVYLQSDLNLIAKTELKDECDEKKKRFLQFDVLFQNEPLLSHVTAAAKTAAANIIIWAAKKYFKFIFVFCLTRFWIEISQ